MVIKQTTKPEIAHQDWMLDGALVSGDHVSDLKQVISFQTNYLLDSLWRAMPNTSVDDFAKIMRKVIAEGKVTDCTMSDEWADRISENNSDRKLNLYKLSHLYCYLAEKARKNAESGKGWSLFAKSRSYGHLYYDLEDTESDLKHAEESPDEKLSQADNINIIHESLKDCFNQLQRNESFDTYKQKIISAIDKGIRAENMACDLWASYLQRQSPQSRSVPICLSIAFCRQSQKTFERGDTEKAWLYIAKAKSYAYAAVNNPKWKAEKLLEGRSKGGKTASNVRYKAPKDEAIKLLKEKCPDGGWDNISSAIKEITGGMESFIESNFINLTLSELPRTLRKWIKTDHDVSAAYNALSAKTPSKSKLKQKS